MPKISIIIPLYNKAAHIKRAVDSVLAQTVADWELIVVDDGSTDRGGNIVKQYKNPHIRYIQQDNQGVSVARNNGIKAAQAELVAFLDADDEWMPQFIETILRLREKFPQAGLYCTAYTMVEQNGNKITPKFKAIPPAPWEGIFPNYFASTLGPSPVWTSAAAVTKKAFNTVGAFPAGETLGEDLDTWFRIALKFPIAFAGYRGAVYYRNNENSSLEITQYDLKIITKDSCLLRTIEKALLDKNVPDNFRHFIKKRRNLELLTYAIRCILAKEHAYARRYLHRMDETNRNSLFWMFWAYMPVSITQLALKFKIRVINRFILKK